MISKNKIKIFNYLNDKEDYTTSLELSNLLNVSTKTINRYILDLNYYLKDYNIQITSSRGLGYKITGSKIDRLKLYKKLDSTLNSFFYDDSYESRLNRIINLFITQDYITIEKISEKLNLSISLVNKFIIDLKEILKKYTLEIKSKPHYGSYISGKEINIRNFILDYTVKTSNNKIVTSLNISKEDINIIEEILINELKNQNLMIFDKDLNFLLCKIMISIFRIKQSYNNEIKHIDIEYKFHNYILINNVMLKLSKILNFEISQNEIIYILKYCNVIVNSYKNKNELNEVIKIIDEALNDIYFISGKDYKKDLLFINDLSNHIKRFIERYKENISSQNALLKEIKNNYPLEFNLAFFLTKRINNDLNIFFNEDEIGYIAVYFILSNARLKNEEKNKTICIICHYGLGTGKFLAEKIKESIKNVNISNIYPVKYLDLAISEKPDLIISTVEIEDISKDIFYVSNIFDKNVINDIKLILNEPTQKFDIKNNIFDKSSFFKMSINTKNEIFEKVPFILKEKGLIENSDIKSILDRENISSTEIGNLVAIPHTIVKNKETVISTIILEKPIIWDKQEIQLIFMIFFNPDEKHKFYIFKYLYNLVKNESLVKSILNTNDFENFIELLDK